MLNRCIEDTVHYYVFGKKYWHSCVHILGGFNFFFLLSLFIYVFIFFLLNVVLARLMGMLSIPQILGRLGYDKCTILPLEL